MFPTLACAWAWLDARLERAWRAIVEMTVEQARAVLDRLDFHMERKMAARMRRRIELALANRRDKHSLVVRVRVSEWSGPKLAAAVADLEG